jgi:hypothetical protein
LDVFSIKK